jgi:hypothetical protein
VDSLDVAKVCMRRWYVMLPLLLLAVGAGLGLANRIKPTYTASGAYAFVYSHYDEVRADRADPRNANPLVAGGTALLGEAVMSDLMSGASQDSLGGDGRGYGAQDEPNALHYRITVPQGSISYYVETWADSSDSASSVVNRVLDEVTRRTQLIQEQIGAPPVSRYDVFITSPTQVTVIPPQSRIKLLIAVLGIGLLVGAAASLLVDRFAAKRRARRLPFVSGRHRQDPLHQDPSGTHPDPLPEVEPTLGQPSGQLLEDRSEQLPEQTDEPPAAPDDTEAEQPVERPRPRRGRRPAPVEPELTPETAGR